MLGIGVVEKQLIASLRAKTKGEPCGSPLFKNLIPKTQNLPFYHLGYCAISFDGVDACGQVRDFDAVGIGGVGYLDAVDIVYTYDASGSREVEHVCHGVRVESKRWLSGGFGYGCATVVATSSVYVGTAFVVQYIPVFVDSVLCWWQGR